MKLIFLLTLLLTSSAHACLHLKAVWSVGEKDLLIDQKVDHDQTYTFSQGSYVLHLVPEHAQVKYTIQAREKSRLRTVTQGALPVTARHETQTTFEDHHLKLTIVPL